MSIPLAQRADAPEFVPLPGEHHGIEWEPLTVAHHGALAALFARMEARDNPPYRTSAEEVEEMLSPASQWRGLVGIVRRGLGAGRMVAFAQVVLRFPGRAECVCVGGVDPDFRCIGLGSSIVDWQEGTARQMLSEVEGDGPAEREPGRFVERHHAVGRGDVVREDADELGVGLGQADRRRRDDGAHGHKPRRPGCVLRRCGRGSGTVPSACRAAPHPFPPRIRASTSDMPGC